MLFSESTPLKPMICKLCSSSPRIPDHEAPKIDVSNSITHLNQTPMIEWYVFKCDCTSKHQKDMCLNEIGLHAQDVVTIELVKNGTILSQESSF